MTVARVAGLPSHSARVGHLPDTVRHLDELRDLRRELRRRGDELADMIYPAIGGCEDRDARRALLACRRAVHNGRAPRPLPESALKRLPTTARALLDRLRSDHEAWEQGWTRAREAFRDERSAAEHRLAEIVSDEDFRRALAMASDALFPDVEAWLSGPLGAPEHLNTRRRVVAYVLRTALKTSPFSTLTTAGLLDDAAPGSAGADSSTSVAQVPAPERLSRHLELNAEIEFLLERLLVTRHGPLVLRANPTLTVVGERLLVVHSDGRCVGVPARPWVLRLAEAAATGAAPGDLFRVLTDEFGAPDAEAGTMIERLVSAGLLQADFGVPDQASERLGTIADRLALPEHSPIRRVSSTTREVAEAADPKDRWLSLGRLRAATGEALTEAGGDESLIPGKYLCYEDVLPGWSTPPATPDWTALDTDLRRIRHLVSVFDGALPGRLAIAGLLERRFGAGAAITPVEAWLAWNEETTGGGDGAPGTDPGDLQALRDNPFHLADTGLHRVAELRHLQTDLLGLLVPPDGVTDTFEADTRALDRLLSDLPGWLPRNHPTSLYLQPLADGSVAFNSAAPGYGSADARLRRRSTGASSGERSRGPLLVEVTGLFRSSLNRVAPLASHELLWPGCVPGAPPERQVRPADLEIRLDPETGMPGLWWRPADRRIELVHRGTMARCWLPPVLRFLLDLATPLSEAWALVGRARELYSNPKPSEVAVLPRLRVGSVLMERRSWIVPREEFDQKGTDDFDRFVGVRERAQELGLPDMVFARAADTGASSAQIMEKAKDRKPRPLDLCSWWGVEELSRMARGRELLLFQEAAPDVFGPDRVVEYAVEVPGDGS
ncbi:lantibiotic dehydratase [Nocardiopsis sp. MG754419]|uniref:lantibiotic dehydratase n=1 Tax=Nocardiopsis sp. MG754419 TaxID=2259865 RepID=UPI001BAA5AB8|nr:lantibiotic dehydratase [Nocardiopsis sp. MG754419]MBR8740362.1 lantibiotic dehydratase [Nocardiopsis sp. MG754419]